MKHINLFKWSVLAVVSAGILPAGAQITSPAQSARNRFGASFRSAFNPHVNFEGVGAFVPVAPTRRTPDGDPFNYDDGYVLTDSSGNQGGFTRYFGYDYDANNAPSPFFNQVPGDGTIVMHSSSSGGISTEANDDDPMLGFEFTYNRELGRSGYLRWGLEGALNYMNVSVHDSRPLSIGFSRTSTPYQLPTGEGGVVTPEPAPYYHGAALSPQGNPVINATPLPSTTATAFASMTGARNFDADVFGFRVGPYLEFSPGEKWLLTFSGGLALAQVNSDFNFTEAVALPNVPPVSGASSHSDLLVGGFVAGNVTYQLTKGWGIFGGVQFQHVGDYSHTVNGRTAVLDLSQTVFVVVGASFSF